VAETRRLDDRRERRTAADDDLVASIARLASKWQERQEVADARGRREKDAHRPMVAHPRARVDGPDRRP
jgi:hypothetical protein